MAIIADLHIHSKHSRGCSTAIDIDNLEKYAKIKGIDLLGTGDFTHPIWQKELKAKLTPDEKGIHRTASGFPFILQTELSLIYSQDGKGRRVHNVVMCKSFDVMDQITDELKKKGRVDYDGRPIFGIPCPDFVEMMKGIDKDIEIIPAHIWTPWFSLFGSNSGFNSVQDCFKDQTKHIYALETGLSSDPPMNWRISQLDKYNLVSFSDLHSFWPWRIGREATMFDVFKLSYDDIIKAIRTSEGLKGTVEVDPNYGKYHLDGHRKCKICMNPADTTKHKGICPACGKPMTIGVLSRVEELADRPEGYVKKGGKIFKTLIPLSEILASILGKGVATKTVWAEYNKILGSKSEYEVLLKSSQAELLKLTDARTVDAILKNREGKVQVKGGYDGEYGVPVFNGKIDMKILKQKVKQTDLEKF